MTFDHFNKSQQNTSNHNSDSIFHNEIAIHFSQFVDSNNDDDTNVHGFTFTDDSKAYSTNPTLEQEPKDNSQASDMKGNIETTQETKEGKETEDNEPFKL
jgi:hypothetical protein